MGAATLSPAQYNALARAARRSSGFLCPMPTPSGAAQDALLDALARKGFSDGAPCPCITDAGRAAVIEAKAVRRTA